jgi:hypothetical protein
MFKIKTTKTNTPISINENVKKELADVKSGLVIFWSNFCLLFYLSYQPLSSLPVLEKIIYSDISLAMFSH